MLVTHGEEKQRKIAPFAFRLQQLLYQLTLPVEYLRRSIICFGHRTMAYLEHSRIERLFVRSRLAVRNQLNRTWPPHIFISLQGSKMTAR